MSAPYPTDAQASSCYPSVPPPSYEEKSGQPPAQQFGGPVSAPYPTAAPPAPSYHEKSGQPPPQQYGQPVGQPYPPAGQPYPVAGQTYQPTPSGQMVIVTQPQTSSAVGYAVERRSENTGIAIGALVFSIFTCCCCCLPLGVVAMILASEYLQMKYTNPSSSYVCRARN